MNSIRTVPCGECDGYGYHEIQIAVDDFKERLCEDCWGEGKRPVTEFQADEV
jgi:DnaJ-class molecular chaperone|tara:strand:- start:423 stop:578 length:156 start_codon:yes stop_codon:yes gene_type:complete